MMGSNYSTVEENSPPNRLSKSGKQKRVWNWTPWSRKRGDSTDINNNLFSPGLSVLVTPTTPVLAPPTTSSSTRSIITLHFIKSKISKFFTFRGHTARNSITNGSNLDSNKNPLLRTKSSAPNNVSRPIAPEMIDTHGVEVYDVVAKAKDDTSKQKANVLKPKPPKPNSSSSNRTKNTTLSKTPSTRSTAKTASTQSTVKSAASRSTAKTTSKKNVQQRPETLKPMPKRGCCIGVPTAPPVYLDYSSSNRCNSDVHGSVRAGNAIIDRLKNVDVIEELQYHVPGGDCCGDDSDEDFDYYYVCDDCGEMELCKSPNGDGKCKNKNPVTYSRRQRFNFAHGNDGDNDGPPWSSFKSCSCPCCRAGLRRDPCCECKCCTQKGRARVSNSFDEIPVGKNPTTKNPKPKNPCDVEKQESGMSILPKDSGVYFFDAEELRFVRQEPRTPTPLVIQEPPPPSMPSTGQQTDVPDLTEVIRCLPPNDDSTPKPPPIQPPQPLIMPAIYGNCGEMDGILKNLQCNFTDRGCIPTQSKQRNKANNDPVLSNKNNSIPYEMEERSSLNTAPESAELPDLNKLNNNTSINHNEGSVVETEQLEEPNAEIDTEEKNNNKNNCKTQ